MVLKISKKGIVSASIIGGLYALFLLSPLVLSPIVDSYSDTLEEALKTATGLEVDLDDISVVTGWNFSAGVKVKHCNISIPGGNSIVDAKNAGAKVALLPILAKSIQIDSVFADSVSGNLVVKDDGNFLLMDYLPKTQPQEQSTTVGLPFGLKLSNHLPNVKIKNYKLAFVDVITSKSYYVEGFDFKLTDFILDKKFKLSTKGKVVFDEVVISNYDVKLYHNLMPKLILDDLVFPKDIVVEEKSEPVQVSPIAFNVIDIFKSISKNKFSADLFADVKTFGTLKDPKVGGHLRADALSVAVDGKNLPQSYCDLLFKGNRTEIDSMFYSSFDKQELTQVIGNIKSGKNPAIDMTFRSNAQFNNLINLVDSIASSFGVNDFNTLKASGGIDADFNLKSDLKKVSSTGYLKVVPSTLSYGLYNVSINDILADIDFMNDNINIKKSGFSILGQPLSLVGTVKNDSTTDLKLSANNLSLKGLLTALGQFSILKDNDINGGLISLNAVVKGKLDEIKPELSLSVNDIDVKNKPADIRLTLTDTLVKVLYDGKSASGDVKIKDLEMKHPMARVSVPDTHVVIGEKNIDIKKAYVLLNNSRFDITGAIKDYLHDKMSIDLKMAGNLNAIDAAGFLPIEFRNLISYKGQLPVNASVTGNMKVQNVKVDMSADKDNYVALVDINSLKNSVTKIHSSMELIGDSLTFSNTGISNDKKTIATLSGGVTKLYSSPKLNLNIAVPAAESFPIWGLANSNITANGSVSVVGDVVDPQLRGTVNLIDISCTDLLFEISDMVADLSGSILNGEATAKQLKFGGIVASDITADFALKDYSKFYLSDITATAFDGKVKGDLSYGIMDTKIGLNFTGTGLNSTKAVEGAVGIKNALTGVLGFNAKLTMSGVTDKEIIKSMKGNVDFNVEDGRFISIGRLENLFAAQNLTSNSVLKSAVSAMSTLSVVQETDKFKYIKGNMSFNNGKASISKILVAGPLMAYYVNGVYDILPNYANLNILGRLESKVVSALGPLGELSADKLLGYIPKFGAATANILRQVTSDPQSENVALIPALSNGSTTYKDFKVVFNGPVEGASSVKSFKWLSTCDTTEIDIKKDLQDAKDAIKTNITDRVENAKTNAQNVKTNVNNAIEAHKNRVEAAKQDFAQTKQDIQTSKENLKQNKDNLKNLFKNVLQNAGQTVPTEPAPVQ